MTIPPEKLLEAKQKAVQFYNDGYLMEALQTCKEICTADDRDPVVFCLMGVIYGQLNQYGKSAEFSRRAIDLNPEYLDAHCNLALAVRQLGDMEQAIKSLEFVLSRQPHDADVRHSLGFALEWTGDYERALAEYRIAQSHRPDHLDARAGEASVHEKRGEFDTAWRIIHPYVEGVEPTNTMMAVVYGRLALARGESDAALPRIERFLDTQVLPDEHRLLLHFALGALCDKIGSYDEAFSHYRQANEIKGVWFDSTGFRNRIDRIIGAFSKDRLAHAPRSDCASDRPVFIVGMMRSGTSLVEQILSSHSAVFGAGELPHIERIVVDAGAAGRDITRMSARQLNAYSNVYLDKINSLDSGAMHVIDKMPQNFLHLGNIELMFPNARVIHCKRNALDTCLSCYFQNFTALQAHTFDLEALGQYYADYRRLMAHWNHVLDIPVCELYYEDLVASPDVEIGRILEFCGLEPEPACFRFHENKRAVRTASYGQVRLPLYESSVNRWHNYEKYLGPLVNVLGR